MRSQISKAGKYYHQRRESWLGYAFITRATYYDSKSTIVKKRITQSVRCDSNTLLLSYKNTYLLANKLVSTNIYTDGGAEIKAVTRRRCRME